MSDIVEHHTLSRDETMRVVLQRYKTELTAEDLSNSRYTDATRTVFSQYMEKFAKYDVSAESDPKKIEAVYLMAEMVSMTVEHCCANIVIRRALDNLGLALEGYITVR